MEIQHQRGNKGMFYVGEITDPLAVMTYSLPSAHQMVIEHTEVNKALRGQNVGYQLVESAVEFARANQLKITPVCPFAASVFRKKKEFADVLKKF